MSPITPAQIQAALAELKQITAQPYRASASHIAGTNSADRAAASQQANQPQRRTICIRFYVTPDEEAQLNALTRGLKNRSRWLRSRALGQPTPRPRLPVPEVNRQLLVTAKNIRANTNQSAKAMNIALARGQSLPLSPAYLKTLHNIDVTLRSIERQLVLLHGLPDGED